MLNKFCFSVLLAGCAAWAQEDAGGSHPWDIHFQATSIGQAHGAFPSPYEGENSLPPHLERRVSLTATLFLSWRPNRNWEFVVNPEIAGGKGFGDVTGIAGFTNGEIPRVSGATPTLYVARAYVRRTWTLPGDYTFTCIAGKFAVTDFFDNNTYSHDPRRQFMNWSLMSNGAWDYPADTRGYTAGLYQEFKSQKWSVRSAEVMIPTEANGGTLDTRVAKNRGAAVEVERRFQTKGRWGAARILGFQNRERAGTFREAMLPEGGTDIEATRRPGTKKYGFGINVEQALTQDIGTFARYGWSDGKTETWAFTQIDRTISGGVTVQGRGWKRPEDHIGVGVVRNGLAGDHRNFLAAGGLGFIIGDGRLNYAPESIVEAYYACRVAREWTLTLDYQWVSNPAYNHDRGPVSVASVRVHWER
jgi:high affinity Mn2+ porin